MELNKIYNEDCLDTMSRMPDNFVDLVVTSPPYNMRTRVQNGKYTKREKSEHFSKKYKFFSDDLPIDEFYQVHKKILEELLRVSKLVCYNFQIVTGSKEAFFKIIGDFNIYIKDIIVWDKGHGQPSMHNQVLNSCYELILILENDKKCGRLIQNAKFERGKMDNILRIGRGKKVHNTHGAVFPEKLAETLIEAFSNPNELVYDPFMGSGTTAKMSIINQRNYIGSEISQEYCTIAEKRIEETKEELSNKSISLF